MAPKEDNKKEKKAHQPRNYKLPGKSGLFFFVLYCKFLDKNKIKEGKELPSFTSKP